MPNESDSNDVDFRTKLDRNILGAMKKCQDEYRANDVGHRETRWKLIQRAALVYRKLKKSRVDRKRFRSDSFWGGRRYAMNEDQLMLHCMQYLVNAPSPKSARYNTACDYAAAAELLLAEGHKAREIFAQLKARRGPYNVLKEKRARDGAINADDDKAERSQPEGKGDSDHEDDGGVKPPATADFGPSPQAGWPDEEVNSSRSVDTSSVGKKLLKRVRIFNPKEDISVKGGRYQSQLLNLESHSQRWLLVRWNDDEGDARRIEVINVKKEDEVRIRTH